MTVSIGAEDMSFHDKPMVSWPLWSLVLTFQDIHLVLGAPFYTAAPKFSHRTDHIPATILLEELLVLESENRVKNQARKRDTVQEHRDKPCLASKVRVHTASKGSGVECALRRCVGTHLTVPHLSAIVVELKGQHHGSIDVDLLHPINVLRAHLQASARALPSKLGSL